MTTEDRVKVRVDKDDPTLPFLLSDGLSEFDLETMTGILTDGFGDWFHARLARALHELLAHSDVHNTARLQQAFPGTCAAVTAWYNGELPLLPKGVDPGATR